MRPINLIPADRRQGARRKMRSGPLAYVVVGALVATLLGVTALVVTGNQIADREAEIAQLESEDAAAKARAERLAGYVSFHNASQQRLATITSLATSRFDWERVMRELALVLPFDVWLTSMTGTATPETIVEGDASISLRSSAPGPALELNGCARGQEAVAGFVQALKEIDGVTRVGVQSSALGKSAGAATSDSAASGSACQEDPAVARFQIVVAFDAAPIPVTGRAEE